MAGNKKKPQITAPQVHSVTAELKRTFEGATGVKAAETDETVQRKKKALQITDAAMEKILAGIQNGSIQLTTSSDIERVLKMMMLLSGEPDSITGSTGGTETVTDTRLVAESSMSRIREILSGDDPNVKALYQKLFDGYNALNDGK